MIRLCLLFLEKRSDYLRTRSARRRLEISRNSSQEDELALAGLYPQDEYFLQITKKLTSLKEKSAQREGMAGQPLGSGVSTFTHTTEAL